MNNFATAYFYVSRNAVCIEHSKLSSICSFGVQNYCLVLTIQNEGKMIKNKTASGKLTLNA